MSLTLFLPVKFGFAVAEDFMGFDGGRRSSAECKAKGAASPAMQIQMSG